MNENDLNYFIIFHTAEDFDKALEMTSLLLPDDWSRDEVEMRWKDEWWRNQAVNTLSLEGIEVDTYEL